MEKTTIFIQQLFQLIEFSKTQKTEAVSNASANAATVLNSARMNFSKKDMKGVCLRGANLACAIMSYTDLQEADLRDTKLHGVVVQGANLKYCDMSGAAFGELAYKQFDNAVLSCAYSSNGKLFTVALGTNVILLSVTPSGALGDILQTLQGHTDVVTSVAFSSDNKWVASGSDDKSVRLSGSSDLRDTALLSPLSRLGLPPGEPSGPVINIIININTIIWEYLSH